MSKDKVMITAQVDREFYELVRKVAYLLHISNSEVIRRACESFINSELKVQGENNGTSDGRNVSPIS
jgi:hypothetical protein